MNNFEPSTLRVHDKVGVQPRSDMGDKSYRIAIVSKVTKTQITVTYNKGRTQRFVRETGREYGADRWHYAHLVPVAEAKKANERIIPRQKRRAALRKLSERLDKAGVDTFTQRQLDAAMMALGDVKGGIYPPVRSDLRDFEEMAQLSVDVLVKVKGFADFSIGRYVHSTGEWQVNNIHGMIEVSDWWPLPGGVS